MNSILICHKMKQKKKLREKATVSKAISKLPLEKRERLYKAIERE